MLIGTFFVLIATFSGSLVADDEHPEVALENTPSAFTLFKEQAEQGNVEAQYNLGVMCETGWSIPVDNKKAVRWFRSAAEQGHANAQLRLGMMYYLGVGAAQSNIKGEKWIRKAAKLKQPLAQKLNEALFTEDLPDSLSPSSAMSRVRTAYLNNERKAIPVLESLLSKARQQARRAEKEKEETTLRERRAQKSTEGPVRPGFTADTEVERVESEVPAFMGNSTLEENRTLARGSIATIRLQAEKGLASAQYNLARMYELGIKLPTDKKQAIAWYEKAAKQDYADAEYRLGITLLYGTGVLRDERMGKKWLGRAASHGHPVAKNMMQELGKHSAITQQGISHAVRWYLERAQVDDGQAAFHLGKIYEHGWGVSMDFAEAIKWYQRAGLSGNEEAKALADALRPRLGEVNVTEDPNQFGVLLNRYGLPVWLSHPVVLATLAIAIFWPLFSGRRKRRRSENEVQEV